GMVLASAEPGCGSVCSVFAKRVVPLDALAEIERKMGGDSLSRAGVPSFRAPGGMVKLSAAWLIEHSGFARGYEHGGVGLSSKHALAIVAGEGGTAREVMELAGQIEDKVWAQFGVRLVREPSFVGLEC